MSSEAAIAAEQQRQLSALAQLSLSMAESLQAAASATDDYKLMARLSEAFCKVSRCLRMSIALAVRLQRGEAIAPARARHADRDLEDEDEDEDFDERDERESLYDRLPSGDVGTQIGAIARSLAGAARALSGPTAAEYRARCEALAAEVGAIRPPTESPGRPEPAAAATGAERSPPHARGPPRVN